MEPRRRRDPVLYAASAFAVAALLCVLVGSFAWVGRTFPGFLVLDNRVIASAGLSRWPDARPSLFQSEVVALEGRPVADARALAAEVAARPPGTPLRYTLRSGDSGRVAVIASRPFVQLDWALLFGTYLFCGAGLCGTALCIRYLRGDDRMARGTVPALYVVGMWALTAVDLYGPYWLFRFHVFFEALLGPATLHLALSFPRPSPILERRKGVVAAAYAAGGVLAVLYESFLYVPAAYTLAHHAAQTAFGVALATFVARLGTNWMRASDFETRQRLKVVSVGSVLALTPQVVLLLFAAATGSEAPQNLLAFSGMLFPASVAYAVLRQNLLGVDEMVRRILNYAVLTVGVAVTYGAALVLVERLFHQSAFAGRGPFAFALGPVSVLALLPLRDRLQSIVDRTFFRAAWDFRRVVQATSARLTSVTGLSVIAAELERAVADTLHPSWTALFVRQLGTSRIVCLDPDNPRAALATGLAEDIGNAVLPVDGVGGSLIIPFRTQRGLVAAMVLGRPLSGETYGGFDRNLLMTLGNQGALAIENALALGQLRDLNRNLEAKVKERTRHLADALRQLRETQAQLVHREKMASIGQFVAGIAHEMNNPLSFIEGNLHFLRSYTNTLTLAIARYEAALSSGRGGHQHEIAAIRDELDLDHLLGDLEGVLGGCSEGVTRTAGLVRDLRTFSRLDHAELVPIQLREAIESTLNLLRAQLKGVEVIREFEDLPPVECLAGQMDQVFMNLIANAADAVAGGGRITIRTLLLSPARVALEVEDDGRGIPREHLERIFDPFFTTKEPGKGTGLGLSISYGVVAQHGGSLSVRSEPGAGACFRVELPTRGSGAAPESSATTSRD